MSTEQPDPKRRNHEKWCRIAEKIERQPTLLKIPLENIERWLGKRRDGRIMLLQWRTRIEAAQRDSSEFERLLTLLRADDEESRLLKSYSPFPGILSSEEVDEYTCSWRH